MKIYAVIMAGGSGTRFWPKSTKACPKQFLNLFGEKTMLQETVQRLDGFIPPGQVMVVTNEDYVPVVRSQLPETEERFMIGEPVAKNTAPCIAAAAAILHKKDPDSIMVVLPADHQIGKPNEFLQVLTAAVETARNEEALVTIGIHPGHPETGYGYIHYQTETRVNQGGNSVYRVKNFTEKPEKEIAEQFLQSGDYLWNSGMFIWKTSAILDAFKNYLPDVYRATETLIQSGGSPDDLYDFYHACPSISIDYGIMEKARTVFVVPGDFGWNDVGSWRAVHALSAKDNNGNATGKSPVSLQDASGNLIHSESGKLIALVGIDNIALVETDNAILVVHLDEAQKVKDVVEELKQDEEKRRFL